MKILTMEELLAHLRVDSGEEDEYIEGLGMAAEETVEKYLNTTFEAMAEERGDVPQAVRHACYMIVADLYKNREASSAVQTHPNHALLALLRPFRRL